MSPGGSSIRQVRIDLNTNVDVSLTQEGRAILAQHYSLSGGMNTANALHESKVQRGIYTFRLYELMSMFGSECTPGSPTLFSNEELFIDL
jgi:hypothetical protein